MCRIRQHSNPTHVPICTPNLHGTEENPGGKSQAISMTGNQIIRDRSGRHGRIGKERKQRMRGKKKPDFKSPPPPYACTQGNKMNHKRK